MVVSTNMVCIHVTELVWMLCHHVGHVIHTKFTSYAEHDVYADNLFLMLSIMMFAACMLVVSYLEHFGVCREVVWMMCSLVYKMFVI